jgi:hypothetical protein
LLPESPACFRFLLAIVGEFTLAWLAGCSSFIVFRLATDTMEADPEFPKSEAHFINGLLSFLGKKFGMRWYLWKCLNGNNQLSFRDDKLNILQMLYHAWHMITEESYRCFLH